MKPAKKNKIWAFPFAGLSYLGTFILWANWIAKNKSRSIHISDSLLSYSHPICVEARKFVEKEAPAPEETFQYAPRPEQVGTLALIGLMLATLAADLESAFAGIALSAAPSAAEDGYKRYIER